MKLYGWDGNTNSPDYKTFMAVNNSALDDSGNGNDDYNRTFQGLVESKTSDGTANGLPLLRTKNSNTNASVDPHFDKDFLQGKNAFNTVLGKVYEDVSFPLNKKPFLRKIRTVRTITTRRAKPNIGTMTATKPRCTSNRAAPAKATIWWGMA